MSFSYTLFLALLLLAPGFGFWAGLRIGERSDLVSQSPEKPGSTYNLIIVTLGALAGHALMSLVFLLQALWCEWTTVCFSVQHDPNVYRAILANEGSAVPPSDLALFWWITALILPIGLAALVAYRASGWQWVRSATEAATFGWLKPWVDLARPANSFIIAYVVTKLEHEGANVAYEGIVENIALDDNRAIASIVLSQCDRFLVRVTKYRVERIDTDHKPIPLIQIAANNFVNVALEVFEDDCSRAEDEPQAGQDAPSPL